MSTIHESLLAGIVPVRPTVVKSRTSSGYGARWWVIYPDDSSEWFWAGPNGEGAEDARYAAHAWCDEHVPYSHDRLTNG